MFIPINPLTHPDIVSNIIPYLKGSPKEHQHLADAALVNKAWNNVYTPALWQEVYFNCEDYRGHTEKAPGPDFQRYGAHVRWLEIANLDESHLGLIAVVPPQEQDQDQDQEPQSLSSSPCPNLESFRLIGYNAPIEQLGQFLKSVRSTLQRFIFYSKTIPAEDIAATLLLARTTDGDAGRKGDGGSRPAGLKTLKLAFDHFEGYERMSWGALMRLLETFPYLETLDLSAIILGSAPLGIATDNIEQEEEEEEEGDDDDEDDDEEEDDDDDDDKKDEEEEVGIGLALQDIHLMQGQQTSITSLTLQQLSMDVRTMLRLLRMAPHLRNLNLEYVRNDTLVGVLGALPTVCPNLKRLSIICDGIIPPSATMQLFQSATTSSSIDSSNSNSSSHLRLEVLHLERSELDDSALRQLISTQADTLLELNLRKCLLSTDKHVKAILSGCHRLTSLRLHGPHLITLEYEDGDDSDTDEAYDLVVDVKRQGWPCPSSMKRLMIRRRGY